MEIPATTPGGLCTPCQSLCEDHLNAMAQIHLSPTILPQAATKGTAMDKKKFALTLEREAEGLRWLDKDIPARALIALARISRVTKVDSINDLELWATSLEQGAQKK